MKSFSSVKTELGWIIFNELTPLTSEQRKGVDAAVEKIVQYIRHLQEKNIEIN